MDVCINVLKLQLHKSKMESTIAYVKVKNIRISGPMELYVSANAASMITSNKAQKSSVITVSVNKEQFQEDQLIVSIHQSLRRKKK